MMENLPSWALTNPMPSVYDRESVTAIEMVAKLYGAMQQLIDECNEFEKKISSIVKAEEEKRTDFETEVTKVMRQFICTMEGELQKINDSAEATLQELNESIERAIDRVPGVITERVNELITAESINVVESYDPETESLWITVSGE